MFVDESQFATILESKRKISATLQEINDHRREVRLTTRQPSLEYTTVMGTEVSVNIKNLEISMLFLQLKFLDFHFMFICFFIPPANVV